MNHIPPRRHVHLETIMLLNGEWLTEADLTPEADGLYDPIKALDLKNERRKAAGLREMVRLDTKDLPDALLHEGVEYLSLFYVAKITGLGTGTLRQKAHAKLCKTIKVMAPGRGGNPAYYFHPDTLPQRQRPTVKRDR